MNCLGLLEMDGYRRGRLQGMRLARAKAAAIVGERHAAVQLIDNLIRETEHQLDGGAE